MITLPSDLIPSVRYFKLQKAKRYFYSQTEIHPSLRTKQYAHLDTYAHFHSLNLRKLIKMPTKKSTKKEEKFVWKGYVNVAIPATETKAVEAFIKDDSNTFAQWNKMLMEGYQFKFYYNKKEGTMKVNATCYDADDDNFGYCLSAFAGDWYTALAVVIFKHLKVTDTIWTDYASSVSNPYG